MHTDLWNHAVALYARPGVEMACLELQALGCDVCLLLCGTWLQARQVMPDAVRAQALREITRAWQHDVVEKLRAIRSSWREAASQDAQLAGLREQVKALELQAERIQLHRLQALATAWPSAPQAPAGDWLAWLAADRARGHAALHRLRDMARQMRDQPLDDD
ncbi:TIGR02444 family protein [Pseudomonas fulva]|nr:TIGR02444 family protein [Pseudomonas fulva]MBF8778481.1 TIGR02444 family protein [Pseudomonas fulva]